jgi:predicted dehydrogenase
MGDEVTIALVGIGGYGEWYAVELFELAAQYGAKLIAGIDPYAERSSIFGEFQQKNIPIYTNLDQFYECESADLVIISAPIHFHVPYTCHALEQVQMFYVRNL